MCDYRFEKADKDLFAVYQTVYSQADIKLWFSWEDRVNDTKWTNDCYFLCNGGAKLGGAVLSDGLVIFAFLVPPFCDRYLFWKLVLSKAKELTKKDGTAFNGVLESEVKVLQSLGARTWRARQIICRPTDVLPYALPEGFALETPRGRYPCNCRGHLPRLRRHYL